MPDNRCGRVADVSLRGPKRSRGLSNRAAILQALGPGRRSVLPPPMHRAQCCGCGAPVFSERSSSDARRSASSAGAPVPCDMVRHMSNSISPTWLWIRLNRPIWAPVAKPRSYSHSVSLSVGLHCRSSVSFRFSGWMRQIMRHERFGSVRSGPGISAIAVHKN